MELGCGKSMVYIPTFSWHSADTAEVYTHPEPGTPTVETEAAVYLEENIKPLPTKSVGDTQWQQEGSLQNEKGTASNCCLKTCPFQDGQV